ncbi:RNA polymerase II elongation factor ELL2 [Podargus strigoides]
MVMVIKRLSLLQCTEIPEVDQQNEACSFNLTDVDKNTAQGSFECVPQTYSSSGASQLSCLGLLQNEITVCATSDPCVTTRECMTQAEEKSHNQTAKVVKPGGSILGTVVFHLLVDVCKFSNSVIHLFNLFLAKVTHSEVSGIGKRAHIRRASLSVLDPLAERKRSTPMNPGKIVRRTCPHSTVSQRPYRDRVIHLLALRSYKKPELLARLHRDGISQKDKNSLGTILHQVAVLNIKANTYSLKDCLFKDIQKDWPGYSEIDKQSLELILSRKLCSSEDDTSTSLLESPVTSKNAAPSSSSLKRPLLLQRQMNFVDPLAKKHRISRLTSQSLPLFTGLLPASKGKATATPPPPRPLAATATAASPASHAASLTSLTSPSTPEGQGTQDLPVDSFSCSINEDQQLKCTSLINLEIPVLPAAVPVEYAVSASKEEKDLGKEETAKLKESSHLDSVSKFCFSVGVEETCTASTEPPSSSEQPDYLLKYTDIVSEEQRQSYQDDFNAEFDEYRNLHARIETLIGIFMKLNAQWQLLSPGSKEHQILQEEILEEYQKMKQSSPNYCEEKYRCEYLHNKLSHIKRLIREFDQRQAELLH